jgi:hypothetical protein
MLGVKASRVLSPTQRTITSGASTLTPCCWARSGPCTSSQTWVSMLWQCMLYMGIAKALSAVSEMAYPCTGPEASAGQRWHTFTLPAAGQPWHWAFTSCAAFSSGVLSSNPGLWGMMPTGVQCTVASTACDALVNVCCLADKYVISLL